MTGGETNELRRLNDALFGDGRSDPGLISKVDNIDRRLDRLDGAITFIKAAATFVGFGGFLMIIVALVNAPR